jgi:hypothetical protein
MRNLVKLWPLFLIIFTFNTHALVDYTEPVPEDKITSKDGNVTTAKLPASKNETKSLIWKSDFFCRLSLQSEL